ncbi:MAG: hypothetical protein IIY94_06845 [Oscillospiraceae bacterium]|nr:hypothetical protein [Oscillospiraceae bacterium]
MKRRLLRVLAGLTIPAFCLLTSPKAWAAGASPVRNSAEGQCLGVSLSARADTQQSDLSPAETRLAFSRDLLERSERLWGKRVNRGIVKDTLFLYRVQVDGETVLDRVGSGCIEENYYIRTSDLSDISVSSRSRRAPDWKTPEEAELAEPVGEGANMRLRGYLYMQDYKLYTCREITITAKNGEVVYYDLDQQRSAKDEHYTFLLSTSGSAHSSEPAPDPALPQTVQREWTYASSDGRELWMVALQGSFQYGYCLEASGSAKAISDDWEMEDSEFRALDTEAVAYVTVSRRVLGITVAKETYEFHLTTQ